MPKCLPWCRSVLKTLRYQCRYVRTVWHRFRSVLRTLRQALVPKCLGSEVSWDRSVLTPDLRYAVANHINRLTDNALRRHWSFQQHDNGLWETVRFQLQLSMHGTLCRLSSEINSHGWPFDINWKQYCSWHPLERMLIPEPRHCQQMTVLVFVRWPCNICAW